MDYQAKLDIRCFGGLQLTMAETAVTGFASRKVDALFIYLACNPQPQPRETLATLFWPDNDQSRALANLSVALTSLRKQLDEYLIVQRHTIAFNSDGDFQLDVALFETAVARARQFGKLTRTVAAQLQTAVSLYKGDFLVGFNIRNVPEFEAWVLLEQERLRQQMLNALADLVNYHQQRGQLDDGIRCAQQLLALDPLQEEAHRQLMLLFVLANQRSAALAQYEQCTTILAEALGVEPDEETVALYTTIRDDKTAKGQSAQVTRRAGGDDTLSPSHNLPAATTTFIGREAELAQIEDWLMEANGRLLTIIGPGGMGKTRLAQEAAPKHKGEFADGVWFISGVPLRDLAGLATAVAEATGLTLSGKDDIPTQLLNQLKPLEMLLMLDNLEHLLVPELHDFLSKLTQEAPELRLIVTSRTRLNLQAERLLELHGLPFPVIGDRSSLTSAHFTANPLPLTDYPSIALFTNRVQRIQADFKLDKQETAVVQLCQLVGGLPLALELAATWTRVLSVAEIVTEIRRGLDALSATLHDVPERHRSLRTVIESSWQMLPAAEQSLFRRLAVFRGGFTRTAAQHVANASPPQLMSLVDRSFLRLDEDQRFRRHPLLLQFAQEQLAAQPDEQTLAEAAHAHFFADFVQVQETALKGADSRLALAALGADMENVRLAWQWGLRCMNTAVLDPLITGIGRFFASRGRPLEGALLFEAGLQRMRDQPETAVLEPLITKMQVELGYFWDQTGRLAEAETLLMEAEQRARQHQLTATRINCLRILGVVTDNQGKLDEARRFLVEAHQLCQAHGEADQMLPILNALGNLCVTNAEFDQAGIYFEEAIGLANSLGNTLRLAVLHGNMAIIANRQKNYEEAIRQWQLAQNGFREHNHETGLANTTFNIAMALHGLGKHEEALEHIQIAYSLLERLGQRLGMAAGLGVMGMIYHKLGKRRAARRHLNDCLLLSQEIGSENLAISSLAEIAEMEISGGNLEQAALLLLFITQHPASGGTTKQNAAKLLAELQAELPAALMAEVETAVSSLTLDSIIAQLAKVD